MSVPLEVRFQSLEDGVPDVVMEPAERGDHLPIRCFDSLIKDYLENSACIYLHLRPRSKPGEDNLVTGVLRALRATRTDESGSANRARKVHTVVSHRESSDGDSSVLVPVVHFVENPERVILDRTDCWIWTKPNDLTDNDAAHVIDALMPSGRRNIEYRERDAFLFLWRHIRVVADGKGEGEVVEGTSQRLKSVSDDKSKIIWERLELCADEFGASIAIGLHRDSITLAVRDPVFYEAFALLDVGLRVGQLSAVAR